MNLFKYQLMDFGKGLVILFFFEGYDLQTREGIYGILQSWGHHKLRNTKRRLARQQPHKGFYVAFHGLVNS